MVLKMIIVLLVLHFVGDWVLQSRKMAENKSTDFHEALLHALIIFGVFNLVYLFASENDFVPVCFFALTNASIHIIQDVFIWRIYGWLNRKKDMTKFHYWKDYWFYFTISMDQMLHLIVLFWVYSLFFK